MVTKLRINKNSTGIAGLLFLFLTAVFLFYTVVPLPNTLMMGIGGLLFLYTFIRYFRTSMPVNRAFVGLFLLSFFFVVFRSADIAHRNVTYLLVYLILLLLVLVAQKATGHWIVAFKAFIWIFGFLCAIVTIACYLFPDLYLNHILPLADGVWYDNLLYCFRQGYQAGFASHYSTNGVFMATYFGLTFSIWMHSQDKKKLRFVIMALALFALILTAKRAHTVFGIGAMVAAYYVSQTNHKRSRLLNMLGLLVAGIVALVFFSESVPAIRNLVERFIAMANSDEGLMGTRSRLYDYAITLFWKNPIFGNGWASYKYMAQTALGEYNHVHNVFLQLLTETGIVGFTCFMALFVLMFYYAFTTYIQTVKYPLLVSRLETQMCCFSWYMHVFFFLYCMTGNPLYDSEIWMPVILCTIISVYVNRRIRHARAEQMPVKAQG